jgi:hypothetical protein
VHMNRFQVLSRVTGRVNISTLSEALFRLRGTDAALVQDRCLVVAVTLHQQ